MNFEQITAIEADTNFEGGNVTVLLGDGKGGFREAPGSPFSAGASPFGLAIADIDNPDDYRARREALDS